MRLREFIHNLNEADSIWNSDQIRALHSLGAKSDIPRLEWLLSKQKYADQDRAEARANGINVGWAANGLGGTITANIKSIMIDPRYLMELPGLMGEHEPGSEQRGIGSKANYLRPSIRKHGYSVAKGGTVFVVVNHQGQAFIGEGNNRIALAVEMNIKLIPVNVRYWNGGELADGPMAPTRLLQLKDKPKLDEAFVSSGCIPFGSKLAVSISMFRLKYRKQNFPRVHEPLKPKRDSRKPSL